MTVNGLLAELRKMQREGRGNQTVYVHRLGDTLCLPSDKVKKYHTLDYGHVVLSSVKPPKAGDL